MTAIDVGMAVKMMTIVVELAVAQVREAMPETGVQTGEDEKAMDESMARVK